MMGFWHNLASKIVTHVIKPELVALKSELMEKVTEAITKANAAVQEVKDLRRQLASLQALDIGYHEKGKIIVLANINGKDRVKVIETRLTMTIDEYKDLAESVKDQYGAQVAYVDSGSQDIQIT